MQMLAQQKTKAEIKKLFINQLLKNSKPQLETSKRDYQNHKRNISTIFPIIKQYYLNLEIPYLVKPEPKFKFNINNTFQKKQMLKSKQIQYLQGRQKKSFFPTGLVLDNLNQDQSDLINKKRNASILVDNNQKLLYSVKNEINCITLKFNDSQQNNLELNYIGEGPVIKTSSKINEIIKLKQNFLVRNIYNIRIYNNKYELKFKKDEKKQIINSIINPFNSKEIIISTFKKQSQIKKIFIQQKRQYSKTIPYASAMQNYDINNTYFTSQSNISIIDWRSKNQSIFYQYKLINQERIYDIIWLKQNLNNSPYFLASNNYKLQTFDIRNNKKSVYSKVHMCQQSPPTILQYFHQNDHSQISSIKSKLKIKSMKLINPIVIAHSPYHMGSSLFMDINIKQNYDYFDKNRYISSILQDKRDIHTEKLMMLFDSGKIYNQFKPRSVTPLIVNSQLLCFFHIDNRGGVALQSFINKKSEKQNYVPKKIYCKNELKVNELKQPNIQKVINLQSEKFIESIVKNENIAQQEYQQLINSLENNSTKYAILRKFYNKLISRSKIYNPKIDQGQFYFQDQESSRYQKKFNIKKNQQEITTQFINQLQQDWQ